MKQGHIFDWEKIKEGLKAQLGTTVYETWIEPLKLQIEDERSVVLKAPDQFFCDWVTKHYAQAIQDLARHQSGTRRAFGTWRR